MNKSTETNYMQTGDTVKCGHCEPENFQAVEPCECNCHKDKKTETEVVTENKKKTPAEIRDELLSKIVKAHNKKSRLVTEEDVSRVISDTQILYGICMIGAYAMHHSQINEEDPLSFFVTNNREIIINPVITRHSNYTTDSKEGCMSFMGMERVVVQRYQKMEVTYQTIMIDPEDSTKYKLSSVIEESISGRRSFIFQHEMDHGEANFIYQLPKQDDAIIDTPINN